jgi:hypothetical protein
VFQRFRLGLGLLSYSFARYSAVSLLNGELAFANRTNTACDASG